MKITSLLASVIVKKCWTLLIRHVLVGFSYPGSSRGPGHSLSPWRRSTKSAVLHPNSTSQFNTRYHTSSYAYPRSCCTEKHASLWPCVAVTTFDSTLTSATATKRPSCRPIRASAKPRYRPPIQTAAPSLGFTSVIRTRMSDGTTSPSTLRIRSRTWRSVRRRWSTSRSKGSSWRRRAVPWLPWTRSWLSKRPYRRGRTLRSSGTSLTLFHLLLSGEFIEFVLSL